MARSIKIIGIAPPDLAGRPEADRRQFWSLVAPIALRVKDDELAAGLDANGVPLKPISAATRKHRRSAMTPSGKGDPTAPPLMPARQKSRTRSLLAARALSTHVELYWRFDPFTGDQWAVILDYQRQKGRDVFGVSKGGLAKIRRESWGAWTKWKKTGAPPTESRTAFPSAALGRGPQSRIARVIAGSALPNAGENAVKPVGVMDRKLMTRGINAPTVAELKAGQFRGGMTRAELNRFLTEETGKRQHPPLSPRMRGEGSGVGRVVVTPPRPAPPKPTPRPAARPARRIAALQPAVRPAARAAPTLPLLPPAPVPLTISVFARGVLSAARAIPQSMRYTESTVWIIDAYDAYVSRYDRISLSEYKAKLVEAHRTGLLTLKRFDLPGALSPAALAKDAASVTQYGVAEFHQINI